MPSIKPVPDQQVEEEPKVPVDIENPDEEDEDDDEFDAEDSDDDDEEDSEDEVV